MLGLIKNPQIISDDEVQSKLDQLMQGYSPANIEINANDAFNDDDQPHLECQVIVNFINNGNQWYNSQLSNKFTGQQTNNVGDNTKKPEETSVWTSICSGVSSLFSSLNCCNSQVSNQYDLVIETQTTKSISI